ncbi:MAG: hypothetical protein R3247_04350 [Rhodothermales bacterium]|nr:hypothetical protein [Rhodothermales bacterium]
MPTKVIYNIVILAVVWVAVLVAGIYITMVQQPEELARVEKAEKVVKLKQAELASLMTEHSSSIEQADAALSRWRARYKVIPEQLSGPEVIGYLNAITSTGFEVFDITSNGVKGGEDYRFHSYTISGRGYFTELYRIVWELENNRYFYRIPELTLVHMDIVTEDPDTGSEEMKVMVSFQMELDAIFGGADGMSAPLEDDPAPEGEASLPVARARSELPPVPTEVLPDQRPALNPFFPLIMERIPPNTYGRINVEQAQLVSIVGGEAVFLEGGRYRSVGLGEDVYLGQITDIDPIEGRVEARLNKGGIIDAVELYLQTGDRSRQALGTLRVPPAGN